MCPLSLSLQRTYTRTIVCAASFLGLVGSGCVETDVVKLNDHEYTAKEEGCAIEIFPSTTPPYAWEDIARVEVMCSTMMEKQECVEALKREACKAGGDTIYDLDEGKAIAPNAFDSTDILIGTVALRKPERSQPEYAASKLPTRALGFQFGSSVESTSQACESAGHRWSVASPKYHCSGTPADVGIETNASLGFCEGKLCDLTVRASFESGDRGESQFRKLWKGLRDQYGEAQIDRTKKADGCKGRFLACVVEGKASWKGQWNWEDGQRIVAQTYSSGDKPKLMVRYLFGDADEVKSDEPGAVDTAAF